MAAASSALAATSVRTAAFEYDSQTGLLTAEIVEPGDAQFCVRTVYGYADPGAGGRNLGNRVSATISNCGTSVPSSAQFTSRTSSQTQHASYSQTVDGTAINVPPGTFPTQAANALSHAETRRHDPRFGGVLSQTGPNALTTTRSYDAFGRLTLEVRADGNRTVMRHCFLGTTAGNSSGCAVPSNRPSHAARYVEAEPQGSGGVKNGALTRTYYDVLGREIRQEAESFDGAGQASGVIVKDTAYNAYGAVALVTQPYFAASGSSTTSGTVSRGASETDYDVLGRPLNVWTYDPEGNTTSPQGARSSRIAYEYNGHEVTEVLYRTWRNGSGATVSSTEQRTTKLKDPLGRVLRVTDAQGAQISYQYDAQGNLIKTRDALGNETSAQFDAKGRRTALNDPNTGLYTYTYDALGQLKAQQSPNQRASGQFTTMAYDLLGRMVARSHAEFNTTWTYDQCAKGVGKLCSISTTHGIARTFTYDALGRPSTQQQVMSTAFGSGLTFNTSTTYDANGRIATQTWPSGEQVSYVHTGRGFLSEVRRTNGQAMVWKAERVNAWGKAERFSQGNGVITQVAYEPKTGRNEAIQAGLSSAPASIVNHVYGYDTAGNITDRLDHNGAGSGQAVSENFVYDYLNRLTYYEVAAAAIPSQVRKVALQYNAVGSTLYKSDVGAYAYPSSGAARPHAVQSVAGNNYTYDANGNMTGASGGSYQGITYTSFNLPDSSSGVLGRNGTRYTWLYGPDHERIQETKTSSGGTRTTISLHPDKAGGLSYERETAETGVVSHRHYFSAMGASVAVLTTTQAGSNPLTNPRWSYWHHDHLGSTAAVSDASGVIQERYAYDPFGKRRFTDGRVDATGQLISDHPDGVELAAGLRPHDTDRGFTGHEHLDDVGIVHMNGRIYDPFIGRFMQADPQLQDASNLQNFNRYSYVLNNPLRYTDPTGEWFLAYWLAAVGGYAASEVITSPKLRAVVAIAAAIMVGPGSNFAKGAELAASQSAPLAGFTAGMINTGDLRYGITGALSGAMFYGVGSFTEGWQGFAGGVGRVAMHGAAGCASAVIDGGKCGQGAISAGVSKALTFGVTKNTHRITATVASAIAGGLASRLSGGEFESGAMMGAFSYLFNECAHTRMCGSDSTSITVKGNPVGPDGSPWAHSEIQISSGYEFTVLEAQAGLHLTGSTTSYFTTPNIFGWTGGEGASDGSAFTLSISAPSGDSMGAVALRLKAAASSYDNGSLYGIPSMIVAPNRMAFGAYNSNSYVGGILNSALPGHGLRWAVQQGAANKGYSVPGMENPINLQGHGR